MSKLEVDAIEPQSGTTLTIGASGDSVNIASGATITDFTSTGIDDNATSTAITIDSSERVGIGITSPLDQLSVLSSGIGRVRFAPASGSVSNLLLSGLTTGDTGFQFDSNQLNMFTYGDIAFYPSTSNISGSYPNGEVMRIRNNGKVGINTTSPYGKFEVHSGGGGSNYSGSSAIKSGVTWGSEASSHTISLFNYNENDNSSGMLLVHAKGDNNKCGTLMLLFTKKGGSGVSITTVSSKTDGMSTFSASTSGNNLNISTDSDCAICWQSYYGV